MNGGNSSEALHNFARFIGGKMGLHFPEDRLSDLAQKMTLLGGKAGYPRLESYLHFLMSAPLSREQMELLADALTIGETYFLRDPKSFRVLEEELLPPLIASRRGSDKTLRIWSAGCSSGEEPYSIAILLTRVIPDLADWRITLIASDINPVALERGRRGVYSTWSFRNAPDWLMGYFEQEGKRSYRIRPELRKMVRFTQLNLAEPGSSPLTTGMDMVFCRNVMLYFHEEQIEKTIDQFHASLREGGWLFVGPTEVDHQMLSGFTCRQYDGALVLKKSGARGKPIGPNLPLAETPPPLQGEGPPSPLPSSPFHLRQGYGGQVPGEGRSGGRSALIGKGKDAAAPARKEAAVARSTPVSRYDEAQALYQAGSYEEAALLLLAAVEERDEARFLALAARAYANIGKLAEARECCEKAIAREKLDPQNHYLLSVLREQQGDAEAAIRSLKNALYLDPDCLLAYFALGNLSRARGELREAEQSFGNALRLLRRMDPQEVLPDTEGMTAGGLAQLILHITGAA